MNITILLALLSSVAVVSTAAGNQTESQNELQETQSQLFMASLHFCKIYIPFCGSRTNLRKIWEQCAKHCISLKSDSYIDAIRPYADMCWRQTMRECRELRRSADPSKQEIARDYCDFKHKKGANYYMMNGGQSHNGYLETGDGSSNDGGAAKESEKGKDEPETFDNNEKSSLFQKYDPPAERFDQKIDKTSGKSGSKSKEKAEETEEQSESKESSASETETDGRKYKNGTEQESGYDEGNNNHTSNGNGTDYDAIARNSRQSSSALFRIYFSMSALILTTAIFWFI